MCALDTWVRLALHACMLAQEEAEKRNARANRFNITEPTGPKYAPDEEELAKVARAKKFGVQGYEPAASAMMDMGGCFLVGE